jgi:hypothetical protein
VQIGIGVHQVVVKTEHLAPNVVVTLCQCHVMDVKEEQCVAIKFCSKVDFSATKTVEFKMLTVMQHYVEQQFLSGTNGFERVQSVKDDNRSGWPTTSRTDDNIATVDKMVKKIEK